jgi:kynurenine formamidase
MTPNQAHALTEEQVTALFQEVSNWGKWGEQDQRGTLNYLTPEHRKRGLACAQDGIAVSCATPIPSGISPANRNPVLHMLSGGDLAPAHGQGIATDYLGIATHGPASTHLDALCHVFHDGRMYNGRPATLVTSRGSRASDITAAGDGIVGRGVLLDLTELRGVEYIEPMEPIRRDELDAAEARAGVEVGEGDILFIRVGRHERVRINGPAVEQVDGKTHKAGLHPDCLPWLRDRRIVLLGSDAAHDALPSHLPTLSSPIHVGALVYIGLHLLDNAGLDNLARLCRDRSRYEFLFMLAPLRIEGGTSSPVNPLAIL